MGEDRSLTPPKRPVGRRRVGAGLLAVAVLAAVGWVGGPALWRGGSGGRSRSIPLTPVAASPYRNTRPEARYVGAGSCLGCHPGEHASFHKTGMGRSMAPVDPAGEPPDGVVDHPLSRR